MVALLGAACSGGDSDDGSDGSPAPTVTAADAGDTTPETDAPRERPRRDADVSDALAAAGIGIVDEPGGAVVNDPVAPSGPIELWNWQVDNIQREYETYNGYLGAQLDELAGAPGGLPFSYLVAAWLAEAQTPTAEAAAELMGDQPWEQAPAIVFPAVVLSLFVSDVAALLDPSDDDAVSDDAQALVDLSDAQLVVAVTGVCSTLSSWVNSVINSLVDALTVDTSGTFGWLGEIWNAAVDLAQGVLTAIVEVLTAPVLSLLTDALVVVGTLSMVASLLKPWSVTVDSDDAVAAFAVGDEPDVENAFTITVDTNLDIPWPGLLVDCASVVDLELPDPSSAAGADVEWTVSGLPPFGEEERRENALDDDNQARFVYATGREECGIGVELEGTVSAAVTVTSSFVDELQALVEMLITNQVPVEPIGSILADLFSSLAAPLFDALTDLVQVGGTGTAVVTYHELTDDNGSDAGADPAVLPDGRYAGLFFSYTTNSFGETRLVVPVTFSVDGDAITSTSARYSQHTYTADNANPSYAIITAQNVPMQVSGTAAEIRVAASFPLHHVTYARTDLNLGPSEFDIDENYATTLEVVAFACGAGGQLNRGSLSEGGSFVAGYWVAQDDGAIADLAALAPRISAEVLEATDLPDRAGSRAGLSDAIADLDAAVEDARESLPSTANIEPMLQWASVTRNRATASGG